MWHVDRRLSANDNWTHEPEAPRKELTPEKLLLVLPVIVTKRQLVAWSGLTRKQLDHEFERRHIKGSKRGGPSGRQYLTAELDQRYPELMAAIRSQLTQVLR